MNQNTWKYVTINCTGSSEETDEESPPDSQNTLVHFIRNSSTFSYVQPENYYNEKGVNAINYDN